jgi:hypothetical protein
VERAGRHNCATPSAAPGTGPTVNSQLSCGAGCVLVLRRCRGGHVKSVKQAGEKVKDAVKDVVNN